MGLRKEVPHAKCSPLCAIKEKLQELWDRAYGCINKINDITPDGDGKFTIQGGQNVSITPISNGLAFDAVFPSGVLTINGQQPDANGDISGIATTAQLSDGSVTKVGTANVGTDTKPIKLVDGVPTAVTYDLVDVNSAQTIKATKSFIPTSGSGAIIVGIDAGDSSTTRTNGTVAIKTNTGNRGIINNYEDATNIITQITSVGNNSQSLEVISNKTTNLGFSKTPYRPYNSANINDIVTIGSLASNPNVVHTVGDESISGTKTFINSIVAKGTVNSQKDISVSTPAADQIRPFITLYNYDTPSVRVGNLYLLKSSSTGKLSLNVELLNSDGSTYTYVTLATST